MDLIENIKKKLNDALSPSFLSVEDESHKHVGHVGYKEDEVTHIAISIWAKDFISMNRIERHRLIHRLLDEEIKAGLHSLVINFLRDENLPN